MKSEKSLGSADNTSGFLEVFTRSGSRLSKMFYRLERNWGFIYESVISGREECKFVAGHVLE